MASVWANAWGSDWGDAWGGAANVINVWLDPFEPASAWGTSWGAALTDRPLYDEDSNYRAVLRGSKRKGRR